MSDSATIEKDAARYPAPQPKVASALEGLIGRRQLAGADHLNCSTRTVVRYERAGMPFIAFGMKRLYDPLKVRAWVLSHEHRPEAPRRGRPRKAA